MEAAGFPVMVKPDSLVKLLDTADLHEIIVLPYLQSQNSLMHFRRKEIGWR